MEKKQAKELNLRQPFEMPRPPRIMKRRNRIEEIRHNSNNVYICNPEQRKSDKIIFYLHGGGYYMRISLPHWLFIRKLSNRFGVKVILPDYPTAPAYNYLQTYQFVMEVYKDLLRDYDPDKIYFFGDSAGGGLSLALSQGLKKESLPQPAGLFLLSPWLDVSMTNPEIRKIEKLDYMLSLDNLLIAGELYAERADLKNPLVSPLYGDLTGLPEIYLFIGTHDILLPDCRRFRELVKAAGSGLKYFEYEKMVHCWMLFPIPEADAVVDRIHQIISEN